MTHKFGSSLKMNNSLRLSDIEKNAWLSFKDVVKNFLGNTCASNYAEIVQKLLESYKALGCNMNTKLHFLHCHLASFPENLGAESEEQDEQFHQNLKVIEELFRVDGMYI